MKYFISRNTYDLPLLAYQGTIKKLKIYVVYLFSASDKIKMLHLFWVIMLHQCDFFIGFFYLLIGTPLSNLFEETSHALYMMKNY